MLSLMQDDMCVRKLMSFVIECPFHAPGSFSPLAMFIIR